VVSILGSAEGVARAASESGGEGIEIIVGAIDAELGGPGGGMIVPGYVSFWGCLWIKILTYILQCGRYRRPSVPDDRKVKRCTV